MWIPLYSSISFLSHLFYIPVFTLLSRFSHSKKAFSMSFLKIIFFFRLFSAFCINSHFDGMLFSLPLKG